MNKIQPLVSVIIPVFNRPEFIVEAIKSLQWQTYLNWECIIVDDVSTDNTFEIIKNLSKEDNRVKPFLRNREPKGAPTCRNIGIEKSNGEFIMFLDSDDLLGKKCLEFRVENFLKNKELDFIAFETQRFRNNIGDINNKWNVLINNENDIIRLLRQDPPWCIHGPLWKKKNIPRFKESALAFQEWEFHLRFLINNQNYQKILSKSTDDKSFVREQDGVRQTISNSKNLKEKNINIFKTLGDVATEVLSSDLSDDIKQEATKLLLLVSRWTRNNLNYKASLKVWKKVLNYNAYNRIEYFALCLFLFIDIPQMQKFIKFVAYKIFKREVYQENKTLGKE